MQNTGKNNNIGTKLVKKYLNHLFTEAVFQNW